ncbi:hypothetical protein BC2230_40861 [Burkholderia cepacia]
MIPSPLVAPRRCSVSNFRHLAKSSTVYSAPRMTTRKMIDFHHTCSSLSQQACYISSLIRLEIRIFSFLSETISDASNKVQQRIRNRNRRRFDRDGGVVVCAIRGHSHEAISLAHCSRCDMVTFNTPID